MGTESLSGVTLAMFIRQHKGRLTKGYPLRGSAGEDYETEDAVFEYYDRLYGGFYMDVAASRQTHKVRRYFTAEKDGLKQDWIGPCWMDPPYRSIREWVEKAYKESQKGATVVALLPVWSGDSWFHDFCVPFAHITLLRHRLRFTGPTSRGFQATFPSMVCVWPRSAAIIPPSAKRIAIDIDDGGVL
jgi:phage N-6-adenine-methyltransferase